MTHTPPLSPAPRIAIIGAGMAGLTAAVELLDAARERALTPPPEVMVFDAAGRAGGNVRSERDSERGFLCEWGPEGFLDSAPDTLRLAERAGKKDRLLRARAESARRYIVRAGRLRRVPVNPVQFLFSDILPLWHRLRVLAEPLAPRAKDPGRDESVFEFAARRIGPEAARILVDAMASGVFAGDSRALSLRSAFPKMHAMESRYGGLTRAMIARKREARRSGRRIGGPSGPAGVLTSFHDGMEEFVEGLVAAIGPGRIRLNARVRSVVKDKNIRYILDMESGAREEADAVVLACPSFAAAECVRGWDAELAAALADIPFASIAVVGAGFARGQVAHPLDGFGFLLPRCEGCRCLGMLWPSSTFANRAPEGHVLLRTMIGGATDPDAVALEDAELFALLRRELGGLIGLQGDPVWLRVFRFTRGIAQYTRGHSGRLRRIRDALLPHPGLFCAGTSYHGIAVNSTCERARALAGAVLDTLGSGGNSISEEKQNIVALH